MITYTIKDSNIKIFGRAIHCLAKIGDDLYFDLPEEPGGLRMKTINSSRSGFGSFTLSSNLFDNYEISSSLSNSQNNDLCKISMKSAMWVFKSLSCIEKKVIAIQLQINIEENSCKFLFHWKFNVQKVFDLNFFEMEVAQSDYDSSLSSNHFTAMSRVLNEAALNFLPNLEEVSMTAEKEHFSMKNFIDDVDEESENKTVHTVLTMNPSEFISYDIIQENKITFCLKELRAIIGFADCFDLPLSAHFDGPGNPIIFDLNWTDKVKASLVLATMENDGSPPSLNNTINQSSQNSSIYLNTNDPDIILSKSSHQKIPNRNDQVFRRCFEATYIEEYNKVYASDSEEE